VLTMRHPLSAKLALTSPTSGGRSVGIVCSHTKATEFVYLIIFECTYCKSTYNFIKLVVRLDTLLLDHNSILIVQH
jgi:hypothetical protein